MSQPAKGWDLSYTQNRELSWLKFNARVLEEATDCTVPLMERLRFVSIFTSNLDEFFMVRVGSLHDLNAVFPKKMDDKSGYLPAEQLQAIYDTVRPMIAFRDTVYTGIMRELAEHGIVEVAFEQLEGRDRAYVQSYYKNQIYPLLSPQIIDRKHPFPHLRNKMLYAAALLKDKDQEHKMLGIVGVPEEVPPILILPGNDLRFVRTEDILLSNLKKLFKIYRIVEQCVITVTRNADIRYDDEDDIEDDTVDFRSQMAKLLRKREHLAPVRLEMQGESAGLQKMLQKMLKLHPHQTYTCTCPLVLRYVYQLDSKDPSLFYPPHQPIYPTGLDPKLPIWDQVQQQDLLLFYPYHSMQPFIDLLKQSVNDPKVRAIQITIYRVARKSAIIKHLCAAAENGKHVTVLVELRARFDEQNNIEWANELEEAGCKIIYGIDRYKCHSKICLITRQEDDQTLHYITHIGTGNFNEKTAALYTDFSILTADPTIAQDAVTFFHNMLIGNLYGSYEKLLVAPISLKDGLLRQIDQQIALGKRGHIILKINALTERDLIDRLARASQAGVRVDLIVRGICCLLPGIPGKTEHITVHSIVGRFLEHSRLYCFGDGEDRRMYISSADLMTRNQINRIEIACPIESPALRQWLSEYLDILMHDTVKVRKLLSTGSYIHPETQQEQALSSQSYFFNHLPSFSDND